MPRPRPPYPSVRGLFGKPTVINNVETFANVPRIMAKGAEAFSSLGTEDSKGTKVFALSGKVERTGLVEVAMGTPLSDIVFKIGGGVGKDRTFKAVQVGGPSGGCIPMSHIDVTVDYQSLKSVGAMMGSGAWLSWTTRPVWSMLPSSSWTSSSANHAASAFPAGKALAGCLRC